MASAIRCMHSLGRPQRIHQTSILQDGLTFVPDDAGFAREGTDAREGFRCFSLQVSMLEQRQSKSIRSRHN